MIKLGDLYQVFLYYFIFLIFLWGDESWIYDKQRINNLVQSISCFGNDIVNLIILKNEVWLYIF